MGCGCKNKANAAQPQPVQQSQPFPNAQEVQPQQRSQAVQEAIKKTVEKYYNVNNRNVGPQ